MLSYSKFCGNDDAILIILQGTFLSWPIARLLPNFGRRVPESTVTFAAETIRRSSSLTTISESSSGRRYRGI